MTFKVVRVPTRRTARNTLLLLIFLANLPVPAAAAEIGFSTFLGGSLPDFGTAIALAPDGGVVVVGRTRSRDFPTWRALQSERAGAHDAFVVKVDATGSEIDFATYLGGRKGDFATDVAVDPEGNIYVVGYTFSKDFPETNGLDVPDSNPGVYSFQGFLTKLSPDGQEILFSTRLGGKDELGRGGTGATAVAYEGHDRVWVSGATGSDEFMGLAPVAPGVPGGAFLISIDTVAALVDDGVLLGGSGSDSASHLAWDAKREVVWLAGSTDSLDFPLLRPLRQTSGPIRGGFLARFLVNEGGLVLKNSSILPAQVDGLAVDRKGRVHLTFLGAQAQGAWDDMVDRCGDGGEFFMTSTYFRVQASGRLLQNVQCLPTQTRALGVDRKGRIVIAGRGVAGLPLADPIQAEPQQAASPVYMAVLEKGGVGKIFATYFGGRATDAVGDLALSRSGKRIFLTGSTKSIDFPSILAVQAEKLPSGANRMAAAFVAELRPYR